MFLSARQKVLSIVSSRTYEQPSPVRWVKPKIIKITDVEERTFRNSLRPRKSRERKTSQHVGRSTDEDQGCKAPRQSASVSGPCSKHRSWTTKGTSMARTRLQASETAQCVGMWLRCVAPSARLQTLAQLRSSANTDQNLSLTPVGEVVRQDSGRWWHTSSQRTENALVQGVPQRRVVAFLSSFSSLHVCSLSSSRPQIRRGDVCVIFQPLPWYRCR